jgi:hypothetical protein
MQFGNNKQKKDSTFEGRQTNFPKNKKFHILSYTKSIRFKKA